MNQRNIIAYMDWCHSTAASFWSRSCSLAPEVTRSVRSAPGCMLRARVGGRTWDPWGVRKRSSVDRGYGRDVWTVGLDSGRDRDWNEWRSYYTCMLSHSGNRRSAGTVRPHSGHITQWTYNFFYFVYRWISWYPMREPPWAYVCPLSHHAHHCEWSQSDVKGYWLPRAGYAGYWICNFVHKHF